MSHKHPCRQLILLLFAFLLCSNLSAQSSRDVARGLLDSVSYYIRSGQNDHAERNALEANALGWEVQDSLIIMASSIGLINVDLDNPEFVDSILDQIYPIIKNIGEDRHFIEYYLDKGHVYNLRLDYGRQITYIDSALTRAIAAADSQNMGSTYFDLAVAYQNIKDEEAAIKSARKGLEIFEDLAVPFFQGFGNRVVGISHMSLYDPDSAIHYLLLSNHYFDMEGNTAQIAYNNVKIGGCYVMKEEWAIAENYLAEGQRELEKLDFVEAETVHLLHSLALVYLNTGRPALAVRTAQQGYSLADSFQLVEDRSRQAEVLIRASLVENGLDQGLMDTLLETMSRAYEIGKAREVLDLQEKYESEEKELRIAELALQAKESELNAQQNRVLLLVLLLTALVIAMTAILLYSRTRSKTQQQMNELRRKALQLQINPHFFFNVLNSINHYITENDQKAARYYLAKFAKLMRLALENSQHDTVPLGNELDLVEAYLKLEQMRRDKFEFKIEVDETLRDTMVPPLMLQPFVENSVQHAFPESMAEKGLIQVQARREGDFLLITVQDNGIGMASKNEADPEKTDGKTSLAISILRKRLAAFGNKQAGIAFGPSQSAPIQSGTTVNINIPLSLRT